MYIGIYISCAHINNSFQQKFVPLKETSSRPVAKPHSTKLLIHPPKLINFKNILMDL